MNTICQQVTRWPLHLTLFILALLFLIQPNTAFAQQAPPDSGQNNTLYLPFVQNNGTAQATDSPINVPFDEGAGNPEATEQALPNDAEYEDASTDGIDPRSLSDAEPEEELPDEAPEGEEPAPLIVGGTPSYAGQYPFMVSTRFGGSHICGGSLIGAKWVLTADHCYWDVAPANISVAVGGLRIDGSDASQIISVARVHRYPNSNQSGHNSIGGRDIMILELASPAQLNSNVQTVPYNRDENFGHFGTARAIGWGATCPNCYGSQTQLYVDMPINGVYGGQGIYVGADYSNQTTCFGDSGGPYIKGGVLFGVTSGTTSPFCTGGAIVTDVAKHVDWIDSVIGSGGGPGPAPTPIPPGPTRVPPNPTPRPTAPPQQPAPHCESGHVCVLESPDFNYNTGSSIYFYSNSTGYWHDLGAMKHYDGGTWANRLSSAMNSTPHEAIISGYHAGGYSEIRLKPGMNMPNFGLLENEVDYVYLCPQQNCNPAPPQPPAPQKIELGFEDHAEWTKQPHALFPGTALWRAKTDIAEPRSGAHAQSLSNLAYGYIMSDKIPVSSSSSYNLSAYIRGEADRDSSKGWWLMRAFYYDADGTTIKAETVAFDDISNINKTWQQKSGSFRPPAGAAHVEVMLTGTFFSGWIAFDDIHLAKAGSSTNLAPNAGFENAGGWTETAARDFPATSLIRHRYRIAAPHTGEYAYAISNLAHGRIETPPIQITAGKSYEMTTHMRGEANNIGSEASVVERVSFHNASGAYIGYQDLRWSKPEDASKTWSKNSHTFTAPAGAATVKVQLYAIYLDGWVAFDDVSLIAVGTSTNLIPDGGFEESRTWNGVRWSQFPGTSALRHKYAISWPRSGEFGYAISNLAYGNVQSQSLQALPNTTFTASAYVRGEAEAKSSNGFVWLRVSYYSADGTRISFTDMGRANPASLTQSWRKISGTATTPAGTASIKVQVYGTYFDGWIAMDDVTIQ